MFRTVCRNWPGAVVLPLVVALGACHARSAGSIRNAQENDVPEEIETGNATRVEEVLAGRFPGVRVLRHANGGMSVEIRGRTSITGSNEPLYVIDGMQVDGGGALIGINPSDIANIEVLKDISSLSFYGVRGANGVVLITLKKR